MHTGHLAELTDYQNEGDPGEIPDQHRSGEDIGDKSESQCPRDQAEQTEDQRQFGCYARVFGRISAGERGDDRCGKERRRRLGSN